MKTEIKKLKNSRVEMKVLLDKKDMEGYRTEVLKKLSKEVKVPGFRPGGNIPEDILIKHIGAEAFAHEISYYALNTSYQKALEKEKMFPLDEPQVTMNEDTEFFSYTISFDIRPEISLGDYKKVKGKVEEPKVTEKEIDAFVTLLQRQVMEYKPVSKKATKGDMVVIDFSGKFPGGEEIPNTKAEKYSLLLGSESFIPGFEDQLEGVKADDSKKIRVTFPADYGEKTLAGKEVDFEVQVHEVKEGILPEVNEDFVEKIIGKKDTVENLRKEIEKNLWEKAYKENRAKAEEKVLQELVKQSSFEIPESVIQETLDFLVDNVKMQGLQQAIPFEQYLQQLGKTEAELRDSLRKDAEERVRYQIVVQEIIHKENIQADSNEVKRRAQIAYERLKDEDKKKHYDAYQEGGRQYFQIQNGLQVEAFFTMYLGEMKNFG
jgi:trigger factor